MMPTVKRPAMTSKVGRRPKLEHSHGATRQPMMIPAEPVPVPADCFSAGMAQSFWASSHPPYFLPNGDNPRAPPHQELSNPNPMAPRETKHPIKTKRRLSSWYSADCLIESNILENNEDNHTKSRHLA